MENILLHNPRCSKSREGLNYLKEKKINFKIIEYLKEGLDKEILKKIIDNIEDLKSLIRKSEDSKEFIKNGNFSKDSVFNFLNNNLKDIERPILITEKGVRIGRPKENFDEIL